MQIKQLNYTTNTFLPLCTGLRKSFSLTYRIRQGDSVLLSRGEHKLLSRKGKPSTVQCRHSICRELDNT